MSRQKGTYRWFAALSRRPWSGKQLPYFHTLIALGTFANSSYPLRGARPGEALLAEETGQSKRTIRRHLAQAEEDGWIRKVQQGSSWTGQCNEYQLTFPIEEAPRPAAGNGPDPWSEVDSPGEPPF